MHAIAAIARYCELARLHLTELDEIALNCHLRHLSGVEFAGAHARADLDASSSDFEEPRIKKGGATRRLAPQTTARGPQMLDARA